MPHPHNNEPCTALVIDDEEMCRNFITEALNRNNLNVEQAASGEEALERCAATAYDIIFMDIDMPGIDGFETTRAIRALEGGSSATYIIALSGHADTTEQAIKCLQAGMNDIMMKPFSLSLLRGKLTEWKTKLDAKKQNP